MKLSRFILPAVIILIWAGVIFLTLKGIFPFELIPGSPFDISIIPMMIIFWIIYFILDRQLFRPLYSIITERTDRLVTSRNELETAEEKLDEVVGKWEQRMKVLRDDLRQKREAVRVELTLERMEALTRAKEEAEIKIGDALAVIRKETADTRSKLEVYAKTLAKIMAEKVIGRKCA